MHRLAALLLVVLVAGVVVTAAPAPQSKPAQPSRVWLAGWDQPIDPLGDCRFERKGERLTITVPDKGHYLDPRARRLHAPRLLRDVQGDFVAQVRVGGVCRLTTPPGLMDAFQRAGLLLTDGTTFVSFQRNAALTVGYEVPHLYFNCPGHTLWRPCPALARTAYLRLERRGEKLTLKVSEDGERWEVEVGEKVPLPENVKVGIIAETTAPGPFRPVFDQFKLTRLDGKAR
jgi:regulation of enolase protein 1 (concanavalin A-like superfamily)